MLPLKGLDVLLAEFRIEMLKDQVEWEEKWLKSTGVSQEQEKQTCENSTGETSSLVVSLTSSLSRYIFISTLNAFVVGHFKKSISV